MTIQNIIRWLLPKEDKFYALLEEQARVGASAASTLARFGTGLEASAVLEAVVELEHKGDALVDAVEDGLAKTFVTPIDREDIHRLSSELDDVTDVANLAIRTCVLLGLEAPTPPMVGLMNVLVRATEAVSAAVPLLGQHEYAKLAECCKQVRLLEKEADGIFRGAISGLFHGETDGRTLTREKEILEDLENAVDCCNKVAKTLANLAVKHG